MSYVLYLSKGYASVLKSLNGQADKTFALRILLLKQLQGCVPSTVQRETQQRYGDGYNSCKCVGSAGTAWKIIELLGIYHFVRSSTARDP
jgi:hypothetical protein